MPVVIKMNAYSILNKLGLGGTVIDSLKGAGVEIQIQTTTILFLKGGHPVGSCPVKLSAIQMVASGALGAASQQAIAMKLSKTIKGIMANLGQPAPSFENSGTVTGKLKSHKPNMQDLKKPQPITDAQNKAAEKSAKFAEMYGMNANKAFKGKADAHTLKEAEIKANVVGMDFADLEAKVVAQNKAQQFHAHNVEVMGVATPEIMGEDPVQLNDATTLYQPVRGTSSGSIYHVVGIIEPPTHGGKRMIMAARYKGSTLSVRVEGAVVAYSGHLEAAGFPLGNMNKGYVSMHLDVNDVTIANRTLASLLGGVGLPISTPFPNAGLIAGKGT